MRKRLAWLLTATAILASVPVSSLGGAETDTSRAILEDCEERFTVVSAIGDPDVPDGFELIRNAADQAQLFVGAGRCERYTVNGVAYPTTWAVFAARIESPDGYGCASAWPLVGGIKGDPPPVCNFYLLFALYDTPQVANFWRDGADFSPVFHVENLIFEQEAFESTRLGAPIRFGAGSPAPSPFMFEGVVRERPIPPLPFSAAFWTSGSSASAVARVEISDWRSGETVGALRPEPGSEMAQLTGDDPGASPGSTLLSANRWDYAEITLEVVPRMGG